MKYEKHQFSKPYEPKINEPTVTIRKKAKGGRPAKKKKTLKEIQKFEAKKAKGKSSKKTPPLRSLFIFSTAFYQTKLQLHKAVHNPGG